MIADRQREALLGLAVGDAPGAAVEFQMPGTFEPVTGYRGGSPHRLSPAEWLEGLAGKDMIEKALRELLREET
jgi:ADP-ribosyl-[dinitrogen reductase] hydrolase